MNNKIYIIATAENKHLIIPYLESLGGVNDYCYQYEDLEGGEHWYINPATNGITWDLFDVNTPKGYTEYKFHEQPSEQKQQTVFDLMDKEPNSELDLLKKENEQLRDCLAKGVYALEVWCKIFPKRVDEYDTQFIEQSKQLLK